MTITVEVPAWLMSANNFNTQIQKAVGVGRGAGKEQHDGDIEDEEANYMFNCKGIMFQWCAKHSFKFKLFNILFL